MRQKLFSTIAALALVAALLPVRAFAAAPTAAAFSTAVPAGVASVIQLQGADPDGTPLVYATPGAPSHGALSQLDTATGSLIYTPTAGYVGADSFTYTVTSGGQTTAAATVTITVTTAKTRVIDTMLNPDGTPRQGKVTFVLTQAATSPAGLIAAKSTVSASLSSTGQFDVSLYPSRMISPQQRYQVYYFGTDGSSSLLGVYDIPAATATVTLAPYRVTDTNLALQYIFASQAGIESLRNQIGEATLAALLSVGRTTGKLQKWDGSNLSDSIVAESVAGLAVAGNVTITGNLTVSGQINGSGAGLTGVPNSALPSTLSGKTLDGATLTGTTTAGAINSSGAVTAATFHGNGSALTGIGSGTGGVINTGSTTVGANSDSTGGGAISLQTEGTERLKLEAGLLSGTALDEWANAAKVLHCQGDAPGNGYPSVFHSNFWPASGTDLGTKFFWEFLAKPLEANELGYLMSDGYGGSHALLFGVTGNHLTGNTWDGSTQILFSDSETVTNNEWAHFAVGWDGSAIVTYQNGVPTGRVAFAGPRVAAAAGAGTLNVCGSDHINGNFYLALAQGYEGSHPFYDPGAFPQKSIESAFKRRPTLLGNNGSAPGNFLADYTQPATVIADHGTGFNGRTHPGVRVNHNPNILNGAGGTYPIPRYVTDYTAPPSWTTASGTVPAGTQNANPGAPVGALAFDSFSRANQTFVFGQNPTLGSTEAGSLGALAWSTAGVPTNLYPAFNKWGILNGRAVWLEGPAPAGVAYVELGTANQEVRVTRRTLTNDTGATGVSARVVDGNNYWFAESTGNTPTAQSIALGYFSAGTRTVVATQAAPATNWAELRLAMFGTRAVVSTDATPLITYNAATQHSAGTKAGLSAPRMSGLARYDNWAGLASSVIYVGFDDFNRADDATSLGTAVTGGAWTAQTGVWGISSNRAYSVSGAPAYATLSTGVSDATIEATIAQLDPDDMGLVFRFQDSNNYWRLLLGTSVIALQKVGAGTVFAAGSAAISPATGDVVKVVMSGNSISVYTNGVLRISGGDSSFATETKHGLYSATSVGRFDDFKVY